MPTVLDVVEIVLDCVQFAQDCKNVFHYFVSTDSTEDDILLMLAAFIDLVVDAYRAEASSTVLFEKASIRNLTDPNEFGSIPINLNGAQGGDAFPSYVAAGFLLTPNSGATRPGSKRFAGVREGDADDGVFNITGTGNWNNLETPLVLQLAFGTLGEMTPIILGRNDDGSYDLTRYSGIAAATLKPDLTSQVSRKIGHGA